VPSALNVQPISSQSEYGPNPEVRLQQRQDEAIRQQVQQQAEAHRQILAAISQQGPPAPPQPHLSPILTTPPVDPMQSSSAKRSWMAARGSVVTYGVTGLQR
jgi:hypothetical protein